MNLLAVFQTNLIIIKHHHGPSLASDVQKHGPQIFNETPQVRGGLISFDSVFPLTISIISFTIDTALSNNKQTNIVGVLLLHVKNNPAIN